MTWPGQAPGYKIGEIKIWELWSRAEGILGPSSRFDVRLFHDVVLAAAGSLTVLEEVVDKSVAEEDKKAV